MNSLVRFIEEHGGKEYSFMYSPRLLKGKCSTSNTSCVWFRDELIVNSRIIEYIKLFQNKDVKALTSENNAQTYFYTTSGFDSRNVMCKYSNGNLYNVIESIYPDSSYWDCYYRGLEDGRLVVWNDKLYIYGTRWDRVENLGCICVYELNDNMQPVNEIIIKPQNSGGCEKNWGAIEDKPFTFMYMNNPNTIVQINEQGNCWLVKQNEKDEKISKPIKGSTQVVRFDENTYVSMVHTNDWYEKDGYNYSDYLTAFVFYDNDFNMIKMSDWFVFKSPMCEFTCGLAVHGDDVYITYSQLDCTSHLLITNKETINNFTDLHCDLKNTYSFIDYYVLAKQNEDNKQYNTAFALYNYAAMLFDNNPVFDEMKQECLIKMFCGVVRQANTFRRKGYYPEIIECLNEYINQYPDCCEFYYLAAFMCKVMQNFDEMNRYKQLGDERKLNIHKYFFKYFNPNYL